VEGENELSTVIMKQAFGLVSYDISDRSAAKRFF